jgi:hypothetical protein
MRPRRLYVETETNKPYYIINKKKVYVKVPKGISMKQLQKVNIKNIIQLPTRKRVKRKTGKKTKAVFDKKITGNMVKGPEVSTSIGGLPTYLFQEKKEIPELATAGRKAIEDKKDDDKSKTALIIPSSVKIPDALLMTAPLISEPTTPIPLLRNIKEGETPFFIPPPEEPKSFYQPPPPTKEEKKKSVISGPNVETVIKLYFKEYPDRKIKDKKKGEIKELVTKEDKTIYARFLEWWELNSTQDIQISTSTGLRRLSTWQPPEATQFATYYKKAISGTGIENGDGDGLYNDEIERITRKRLKHFVPCIPADKTDELMKYVARGDKEFAFVINTNPSDSNGSGEDGYRPGHWTCVYIDNRDDYPSCEYFDPLAEGLPPKPVIDIMRKIAKKMNPEKMFKYKQNLIRRQSYKTSNCGQHCIKFIEDRMNGASFCDASGYDDFIAKHQGADNSEDGENDLQKVLPKYNSYI